MTAAFNFDLGGADEWQVWECNGRVGGLARSIIKGDYVFDYGPHILFTIIDRIEVHFPEGNCWPLFGGLLRQNVGVGAEVP